ncbi:hypothetical protein E4U53_001362 [Claviceps sorghi]|nr:hypothetical protein E4U53_001362 [Claviceps sorghi]
MELPIYEDDDAGPSADPSSDGSPSAAGPPRKPFYAKRSHKKSRMGCQKCKARRVKCDEQRPSCGTCLFRKETCLYVATIRHKSRQQKARSASNSSRSSLTSRTASCDASHPAPIVVVREPVASLPGYDPVDMRIIWHFITNTCSSFSTGGAGLQHVMRIHVMKHAFDARFLFRTILALSCLHARTCTGEEVGDVARHRFYQNESLQEYRLAIEAAEPRTFGALLANSLLVTVTSSEAFRDPAAPDLYILQWLLVWRGIGVIFNRINRSALSSTGLTQLFHRPSMDLEAALTHVPPYLTRMVLSIGPQDADFFHRATYMRGLKYLGSLYQSLREDGLTRVMKLRIITWFTYLPSSLVELFREKRERALVILAYYAAFLKFTSSTWWLVGVGNRSLRDICAHLGLAWYAHLDVAFRAISIEDTTELARLLLDDPYWEPSGPLYRSGLLPAGGKDQEQETRHLGLVDNEGRPVRFSQDAGAVVLAEPSQPGEEPVWDKDE